MATAPKVAEQVTPPDRKRLTRDALLVMAGLIAVIGLMFSGYSSGFGDPTPHNIPIAVVGTQSLQSTLDASPALAVHPATSTAAARTLVLDRDVYGALDFSEPGHVTLFVASGASHSVSAALTSISTQVATSTHTVERVVDLAPTAPNDPNGTVEFYCIVFLAIGAALGATVLGKALGPIRDLRHLASRLLTLVVYSFLLSGTVAFLADVAYGALVGHFALLMATLWAYTFAVALAASGVSALFGQAAGLALTLSYTIIGNTSAGGAVGRPLINGFFAAMNPIFPHGAGITLVRSMQYFGGRGIGDSVLNLSIWAGAGLALLIVFALRQGRSPAGRHEKSAPDLTDSTPAADAQPPRAGTASSSSLPDPALT